MMVFGKKGKIVIKLLLLCMICTSTILCIDAFSSSQQQQKIPSRKLHHLSSSSSLSKFGAPNKSSTLAMVSIVTPTTSTKTAPPPTTTTTTTTQSEEETKMNSSDSDDDTDGKEVAQKKETSNDNNIKSHYDSIVVGGGPAGLLTAIMLSSKYGPKHRIAVCERLPNIPPSPSDNAYWTDVARFYLLGIGFRGQSAFEKFGLLDDFIKCSVLVEGRRDWAPGKTKIEDGKITPATKTTPTRVLPRDKLVGMLHHHILEKYADAQIDLLYGYQVEPISFGDDDDENVSVSISRCDVVVPTGKTTEHANTNDDTTPADNDEDAELCEAADDSYREVTTNFLVGADGSARSVANAMERVDADRWSNTNPFQRLVAPKPFQVTRFEDDNPKVYKSVPIALPSDWPTNLNYSARSSDNRITLEALPSDNEGNLCALLLMKPDDELAQPNVDAAKLRQFFDKEFPQFSTLIDNDTLSKVATKSASSLPMFRFAGPRLNMGKRTIVLGDAAHTVKPYFGLGANTALEDVQILSDVLDKAAAAASNDNSHNDDDVDSTANTVVPTAVQMFSNRRAADSAALVTISRNMDRTGKLFVLNFLLPLILDGIFHKMAPKIFGPNMFQMFQKKGIGFKQIQRKKRLDRSIQVLLLSGIVGGIGYALKTIIMAFIRSNVITRNQKIAATALSSTIVTIFGIASRHRRSTKKQQTEEN